VLKVWVVTVVLTVLYSSAVAPELTANTCPAVPNVVRAVPPFATGSVPVTPVVKLTLVTVFDAPLMVLFVTVCEFVAVRTLVGVIMFDSVVIVVPLQ
jgi:hypothetical protein